MSDFVLGTIIGQVASDQKNLELLEKIARGETVVSNTLTYASLVETYRDLIATRILYEALLYAVAQKHDGESRHETALRYIREREERKDNTPCSVQ